MRKPVMIAMAVLEMLSMAGCDYDRKSSEPSVSSDIVAQYRDTILRTSDIARLLPPGISSADSISLAQSIIDGWIDGFLIEDLAASQIDDMQRIERLTESYRRSLISESYRRKMRLTGVQPVDQKGVRAYYRRHRNELRLERPIIKGIFIKLPASSRFLDDVRSWMKKSDAAAFDELENIGLKETARFQYFADRWVDWDAIADIIPFRFNDPDKLVESNSDFETEHNGTVYMLHISDYRHSGELMPEEYATPLIEDRIKDNHLADYERGLIKALRQTALDMNILKLGNPTE